MDLQRCGKSVSLLDLSIYYIWKNIKSDTETIDLKYQCLEILKDGW